MKDITTSITLMNTQEYLSMNVKRTPMWITSYINYPLTSTPPLPLPMTNDVINHPSHYIEGRKYEPIAVIEDWNLSYQLGNVLKYISRAGRKDKSTYKQDLEKARWYLQRAIDQTGN